MNVNTIKMDPLSYGFFLDESLEFCERAGLALKYGAQYIPINFSESVMPQAFPHSEYGCGSFGGSSGFVFNFSKLEKMREQFPMEKETIDRYEELAKKYSSMADSSAITPDADRLLASGAVGWGGTWGGHANPDYDRVVNVGTEGLREVIAKYRKINTDHTESFYNSCEMVLDAFDILGDRFRELAQKLADETKDAIKKGRYLQAVEAFKVVPRKPAYDFASACMVFWMVFTFDGIDSPGRFDQFMIKAWNMTEDKASAIDALERLWEVFHETRTWNLCLSGSDENWNDETNELSVEILRLAARKRYQTPNITLRVHRNTPEYLWDEIANTLASGIGMPSLYNDEVVCPALEKIGIPPCHSHLYCMNGCNQIDIMGKSHMGLEDGEVSLAKVLEFTLLNGQSFDGLDQSICTGDPAEFETFEDLWRAFDEQLQYTIHMVCQKANNYQHRRASFTPNPLRSCLIDGCIEKGIDYRNGGPLYGHGQILAETIADCGDSLWALKKKVFIEKKYTMAEVVTAIKANFDGYEEMRHELASCEKFGNDIPECDEMSTKALNRFLTLLKRYNTYRGGIYTGGCSPFCRAAGYGKCLGALPNGRRNGEPLVADSIAATPGRDEKGPTALMKSVLGYEHMNTCSGFIFQVKFEKKIFDTDKGREAFKALAKAYFAGGGQNYTVSVVNTQDLLDAQKDPDAHRDLIVRVGGYSAYFVNLDIDLQNNVIARSIQEI